MADPRVDVWLLGFERAEGDPIEGLRQVFDLDQGRAEEIEQTVPCVVKRNVSVSEAARFVRGLRGIGAQVECREARGTRPPFSHSLPPPPPGSSVRPGVRISGMLPASAEGKRDATFFSQPRVSQAPGARADAMVSVGLYLLMGTVALLAALLIGGSVWKGNPALGDFAVDWLAVDLLGRGFVNLYYAYKFNRVVRLGPVFAMAALVLVVLVDCVVVTWIRPPG